MDIGKRLSITSQLDAGKLPKTKSACKKIKLVLTNITVEPILICCILPSVMASLATQNLNLEKACRVNLRYNDSVCDALQFRNTSGYDAHHEITAQRLVAAMNAWKNLIQSLLPSILMMFIGSWSDRHSRRKPCIMIPIVGEMTSSIGLLLCTYFFYELLMQVNALSESVPPSLTGGSFCIFVGAFSYVSSRSSTEKRTVRIGAVSLFSEISFITGTALSGILYKIVGFYGVYSLALLMYTTGLLYGYYAVPELAELEKGRNSQTVEPVHKLEHKKKVGFLKDFFDLNHISETFKVAFKTGSRGRKKRICVIMVLVMIIVGPGHGESNVRYLFVRYRFGWDEMDYALYTTFNAVFFLLGTLFSLLFLTRYLKLDDALLGIISSLSKIASAIVYTFAPNSTIFYLGAIVEMLNGTSFIAMRSIVSKLVPQDELGKINSLFGVSEALMPLIYGPMYSLVYNMTINTLPGSFFLLGGILTLPSVFIFLWLYNEHRKDAKEAVLSQL